MHEYSNLFLEIDTCLAKPFRIEHVKVERIFDRVADLREKKKLKQIGSNTRIKDIDL